MYVQYSDASKRMDGSVRAPHAASSRCCCVGMHACMAAPMRKLCKSCAIAAPQLVGPGVVGVRPHACPLPAHLAHARDVLVEGLVVLYKGLVLVGVDRHEGHDLVAEASMQTLITLRGGGMDRGEGALTCPCTHLTTQKIEAGSFARANSKVLAGVLA